MFVSKLQFDIFELGSTQMHNQLHASLLTEISSMNLFQCCTIGFEPPLDFFIQLLFPDAYCVRTNWKNDVSRIPIGKLVQCTNVGSILAGKECILLLVLLTFFTEIHYLESENWQMIRFGLFNEIQARPTSPRAFPRPSMTAT